MPAFLTVRYPQSFAIGPSNTQLLSFKPLVLAGITNIWQLPADTWRPSSRFSPRASFCTLSRAAINYMVTMSPSVAEKRTIPDFPLSGHHPQPAQRRAAAALGRPAAAVSSLAGMVSCQTLGIAGMVGAVVLVGLVARSTLHM